MAAKEDSRLHELRFCAALIAWSKDRPVHDLMLDSHDVLGRPLPLVPWIFPWRMVLASSPALPLAT